MELSNVPYVGGVNLLSKNATDSSIVLGEGGGFMRLRDGRVNDIAYACRGEVHVKDPAPLKGVGVWTWWFKLLDGV